MIAVPARVLLVALALALALGACRTARPPAVVETVEVAVPVPAECPAPPSVARPALPIGALRPGSEPADVARAYVATIVALQTYAAEIERLLAAYRPPADSTDTPRP